MPTQIQLSVIIPVFNGVKTIQTCLDSIFACKETFYEVIVIDDGSTDNTAELAQKYPCKLIRLEKNQGRSYARNRGIEASLSDHLVFTDSDCIVCDNWPNLILKSFLDLLKHDPSLAAMEGRILPISGFINKCDAYAGYGYNQNLIPGYHEHFCTANLIADKKKILEAGSFNNDIRDIEDQDLGFRLLEKGYTLYYQPAFSVIHNHTRNNLREFLKHYYDWGRSLGNYFDIRYKKFRRTPLTPWMNNFLFYLLIMPVFSFLVTLKITWKNLSYDPSVIFLFPFIFLSKIAYRIGALSFIKTGQIQKYLPTQKEQ